MRPFVCTFAVSSYIVLSGCSSSSGGASGAMGGAGTSGAAGSATAGATNVGGNAAAGVLSGGTGGKDGAGAQTSSGGTRSSGGAATAGTSGANAGATGSGGSQNRADAGAGDITQSPECAAYCAKVKACGASCDPAFDCAPDQGSCATAHRAYLKCEAMTGQFYCGADGFSVVSNCHEDTSGCPTVTVPGAGSCAVTPPDTKCLACAMTACATAINALKTDSELPDFRACVDACEKDCNPPAACPSLCADSVSAFSEWTDVLYCANGACPDVCGATTVIF